MTERQLEKHIDWKRQGHMLKLLINNITMKCHEILTKTEWDISKIKKFA